MSVVSVVSKQEVVVAKGISNQPIPTTQQTIANQNLPDNKNQQNKVQGDAVYDEMMHR